MPTYAYRGIQCPHEFETHQSFSEDPLTECAECGQPTRRVIQLPGIVFKGSGWYINDSRKSSEKPVGSDAKLKAESTPSTTTSTDESSSPATSTAASPTAASTTSSTPASSSTATATKD